jgi:hypothetical protein
MATLADILRQTGYSQGGTLATPTPIQSPMTKVLADHIASLPQKTTQNIEQMNWMVQNSNPYDYTGGKNPYYSYDPKAAEEFANYVPNLMGATAWHGTPHKILGKFDISKVGTGEGAQAYGHGMYFAENPAVAKEYQKALSGRTDMNLQPSDPAFIHAVESFREVGTPLDKIPAEMKKAYKSVTDQDIKLAIQATEKGNLYKVDIPDEQIPNMLDWDKPLSQQPNVFERLKAIDPKELDKLGINPDFTRRSTGKELTGESLYDVLTTHNSQKGASNLLAKQGITGIRYLDQGSRPVTGGELIDVFKTPEGWKSKIKVTNRTGTDFQNPTDMFTTSMPFKTEAEAKKWANEKIGSGTSNFVVFDPSTVKILEENSKPLTRKELIEQQLNKVIE